MLFDAHGCDKRVIRRVTSAPSGRPAVTAVVPSYNYARFLPECVRSVLSQRDVDVQVLIIDDCSSDETPRVTAELAADPRVTVVRNEPNRGMIASVNLGFSRVTTEYVVKLDADDLLAPGALARATGLLEAHPCVGFVYGRPEHFTDAPPAVADRAARSWTIWSGRDWIARRCRRGWNVISQPEAVMRTPMLRQLGDVPEELPHTSDLNTWLRLAALGEVGRVNGPIQGLYRVHAGSMQRTVNAGLLLDYRGRLAAFDAAFAAEAGALPAADDLGATARRTLATTALDAACRAYERGKTATVPVADLVAFALETYPSARELPGWDALERRRAVGPERARRRPRFFARVVTRRAAEEFATWRWLRTGER